MTIGKSSCGLGLFLAVAAALVFGVYQARAQDKAGSSGPNLNGVWQGFVVEGKGENPNRGQTHLELTIKDNQITAQRLDGDRGSLGQGVFKLAPGPRGAFLMDALEVRTRGKPRAYQGIALLNADEFRWCVGSASRRPANFETKGQQFLLILKRQK